MATLVPRVFPNGCETTLNGVSAQGIAAALNMNVKVQASLPRRNSRPCR